MRTYLTSLYFLCLVYLCPPNISRAASEEKQRLPMSALLGNWSAPSDDCRGGSRKGESTIWRPSFIYITAATTVQLKYDVGHSGKAVMHYQTSTPLLALVGHFAQRGDGC
jgi:hypothetical protein